MSIEVRRLPSHHVAYIRAHGLDGPERITLGVAYGNPASTPADKTRYDACVVVPADFRADALIELMDVPGGAYVVGAFAGGPREIVAAWHDVFARWLPDSGYEPDDRPCFELYRGDPTLEAPGRTFRCELCLPVRRV